MARNALITGASSGIGLELARLFAADAHDLILVARREDRLAEVGRELHARHGVRAERIVMDLAEPGAPQRLFDEVAGRKLNVDFLVNISNDGWFKGTSEHELHLATCRFRAVENRRPVARAVNMGISAVIDGDGRVVALPDETWSESKSRTAVVSAAIPLDGRDSVYSATGDWFGVGVAAFAVIGVGLGLRVRRDVV